MTREDRIDCALGDALECRQFAQLCRPGTTEHGMYLRAAGEHLEDALAAACEPEPLTLDFCPTGPAPGEEPTNAAE